MSERYTYARSKGIEDRLVKAPTGDRVENDAISTEAERFFAARYGLEISVKGVRDCDIVMPRRKGKPHLDVKWTPYPSGGLLLNTAKQHLCLVYVLVRGMPGSFDIVGWEWGFRLKEAPVKTDIPKPAPYIPGGALRTNTDLMMAATFGVIPLTVDQPEANMGV